MAFRRLHPGKFSHLNKKLHNFYASKGLEWAYGANVVNILSACEDHNNIVRMWIGGRVEAVAQTQQMELERIIMENHEVAHVIKTMKWIGDEMHLDSVKTLRRLAGWGNPLAIEAVDKVNQLIMPEIPEVPIGYFSDGTSFRDENVVDDWRHNRSFFMSEFESVAKSQETAEDELHEFITDLLLELGFETPKVVKYEDVCREYGVEKINDQEETRLVVENYYNPVLISKFPFRSDPFWNMYKCPGQDAWAKFDITCAVNNPVLGEVIGLECGGTAVRSCNKDEMRKMFNEQDGGKYKETMERFFSPDRVETEFNKFLQNQFIPRYGGGIGFERILAAMEYKGLS